MKSAMDPQQTSQKHSHVFLSAIIFKIIFFITPLINMSIFTTTTTTSDSLGLLLPLFVPST